MHNYNFLHLHNMSPNDLVMNHQSLSISIPEPCHEKWSEMTPEEKGRHCKSCQKTVIDFTRMPKVEIAEFVSEQKGSLCGRFSSDQLNVELIPPKPSRTWLKYAAIILGLVPALGYGQEVIIPQQPNQEILHPPITGDIIIEKHGEVETLQKSTAQEIQISGIITDSWTKKIITKATIINFRTKKVRVEIEVDENGRFQAMIPSNSSIAIYANGYQPKLIKNPELTSNKKLHVELIKFDPTPMGVIAVNPNKKAAQIKQRKLRRKSKIKSKTIENIQSLKSNSSPKLQSENQKSIDIAVNNMPHNKDKNNEEPLQYLFSTVEIVATKKIITKGAIVCGNTVTEERENWFQRQWRIFKLLISESLAEAKKQRIAEKGNAIAISKADSKEVDHLNPSENHDDSNITINDNSAKDQLTNVEINIFPNPSSGQFNIELPSRLERFSIDVTNSQNQLLLRKTDSEFDGMIDLSYFISGTYIISIISDKRLITSKVVVKM